MALAAFFVIFTACSRQEYLIPHTSYSPGTGNLLDSPVWKAIPPSSGFNAPWDGLTDETEFRCFATDSFFYFRFDVPETTLTLTNDFKEEMDVAPEDRVEVFFSRPGKLGTYLGAEMDPAGRVLDYKCTYYRKFDYGWNFRTLDYSHKVFPGGYSVAGRVSLEELRREGLGIDIEEGFLMGVFRADFCEDGSVNWYSMKKTNDKHADFHQPKVFFKARLSRESFFDMKGVVLSVEDLETAPWPKIAHENGINTIGTHITPSQVLGFMETGKGKAFLEECKELGIEVEHQLHAMGELLPRDLFEEDSTMFRMDGNGRRVNDFNCCPHSEKALDIIARKAAEYAAALPATNHRYYFWLDDNGPVCSCPECRDYSPSEQALLIENRMIKAIREVDPEAMLAHLAYHNTMEPPVKVKPEKGIFLEFAPIDRQWDRPLSDLDAPGRKGQMSHKEVLRLLEANLKVFPAETAVILEYWLDVSLASDWKKPAVNLPWHPDAFVSDLATYAGYGLRNITTFAVYMDSTYFNAYPEQPCLPEYGMALEVLR